METSIDIQALWDRAIMLHGQFQYGEALECLIPLEARLPGNPGLLANLGVIYRDSGELTRAESYLRRACAAQPADAATHFNLALTLLRAGRLREGFREYEWRWQLPQFAEQRREFPQPLWRGEALHGRRILIHGEQGAGDAIQFARYAPLVRNGGAHVTIEVLPSLERLLGWMDGEYAIVNALTTGVQFDVQCPLMALPYCFDTELDSIPPPACFSIPEEARAKWKDRLRTQGKSVGLVWAGNPRHANDAARSIPADLLSSLTRLQGIQWYSLQTGSAAAHAPEEVVSLAEELTDFAETAGAISALDLVITVDTAVAHLAGSLNKPVWLLLPYTSDWRWMVGREDTPWYPAMRLFRQARPGDWSSVIDHVMAELVDSDQ